MDPLLILRILKSRLWWLLGTALLTAGVVVGIGLSMPIKYTATTSLVFDFPDFDPLSAASDPHQLGSDYMRTQVDIIASPKVAGRVIAGLPHATVLSLRREFLGQEGEYPISDVGLDQLEGHLLGALEVAPSRDSRVIFVRFTCGNRDVAAQVTNAFAKEYTATALELRVEPAKRNAEWFDGQLAELRDRLVQKQRALTEYQEQTGIVALDERLDAETRRMDELSSRLLEAQQRTYKAQARGLGTEHPEYRSAVSQEQALGRSLKEQRAKLLTVKRERDKLDLLVQDVQSAKSTYDAALRRFYETSLESQFNQTNISVLSWAKPPAYPAGPGLPILIVLAAALGLLAGLATVVVVEVVSRRLYTDKDVERGLAMNVLAKI